MIRALGVLALLPLAVPALPAQGRPELPSRTDTLVVRYQSRILGQSIVGLTRRDGALVQVYVWTGALGQGSSIDSLVADPQTLLPTRQVRVIGDSMVVVTFGGPTLRLQTFAAGRATSEREAPGAPMLFSSGSLWMLAAAMPFTAGAASTVATYYSVPTVNGIRETTLRTEGREMLNGREAWRVVADTPGGGTTFWVDAETRAVLQRDTLEGGALITFRR